MDTTRIVSMIGELIALPSVSSVTPALDASNRPVTELLASWLDDLGFGVAIQPVPGHPGKVNLIARLGAGADGLVLAGHTDTVPYDEGRWQHDPFSATVVEDRLHGLGTADMKSFFAIAIAAARAFRVAELVRPLTIVATADEESSMSGAQALVAAGQSLGRYAVIGEPTGLRPVRMHKGIFMEGIRVGGRSGHSSDPTLGASALEGMHRVIGALLEWRRELQDHHRNPAFAVAVPTLNLGHIHGGDNPNRICGACELHLDLRLLPGMQIDTLRAELHRRAAAALGDDRLEIEFDALFPGIPALETAQTSAIVAAAERLSGHGAGAVAFGTEAPYLTQIGLQTVVLGPGHIDQAHQPDEYLALDQIRPAVDLVGGLIRDFCTASPHNR